MRRQGTLIDYPGLLYSNVVETPFTDEIHEGRPITVATEAVRCMNAEDNRITYRETVADLHISVTAINKILHEHLVVKQICASLIPHNLKGIEKVACVDCRMMSKNDTTIIPT